MAEWRLRQSSRIGTCERIRSVKQGDSATNSSFESDHGKDICSSDRPYLMATSRMWKQSR